MKKSTRKLFEKTDREMWKGKRPIPSPQILQGIYIKPVAKLMISLRTVRSARAVEKLSVLAFSLLVSASASAQVSLATGTGSSPNEASPCTNEDRAFAEKMGSGPADEAYEFGQLIQAAVAARDIESLFELTAAELGNGPRRKFVQNKSFSDIFSEEWRTQVLANEPRCTPVGWRGYMLSRGQIWYSKSGDIWVIRSINGASVEPLELKSWTYNDQLLRRTCFTTRWTSGDNYEEFEERFRTGSDFHSFPGRYVGETIPLGSITSSWGIEMALAVKLSDCIYTQESSDVEIADGWVSEEVCDESSYCLDHRYTAVRQISREHCSALAPFFAEHCIDARLIQTADQTGSSMGDDVQTGIFGIVKDPTSTEIFVTPLVSFSQLNNALNFVDDLEGSSPQASGDVQTSELHASLREFAYLVIDGTTEHYRIRIDFLGVDASGEEEYRYAVWARNSSTTAQPDLVLIGGKVRFENSDLNRSYIFFNGDYKYIISVNLVGEVRQTTLTVTKKDEPLLSEAFL